MTPNTFTSKTCHKLQISKFAVNCTWDTWTAWETCSVTCGGGTQDRNREVGQEALFGGNECTGDNEETQSCNNNGCPGMYRFQ